MGLPEWHAWSVLLVLTLAGDALCVVLAAFGDLTGRTRMPHAFWWILWLAQIPLGLQILLGLALYSEGARPRTSLHYLYGGLIVADPRSRCSRCAPAVGPGGAWCGTRRGSASPGGSRCCACFSPGSSGACT